ncbi:MAG TPA: adenylate/guanylate cyclase domain-containing protein [Alphaproteobacteria bacterium]|nr:adenylate/guanylate cyclase domain-containing protein [Alphaproteobacteria bacterium]
MERRLSAILATDVVGYSRLMEADEAGTLAALKSRRLGVFNPLVAKHQGRIFKVTGDGVLVEFTSAVNAVQCAVDLQRSMAVANGDLPKDRRIVLRIGVNLGEVVMDGGDRYGDGVNIAARLESMAEPEGICISAKVYDEVRGKLSLTYVDLGEQRLKNMTAPIRVYRVVGDSSRAVPSSDPPLPAKPSVAVLPFVNMSGDPEQEFLSDGITEDLVTLLSRFRELFVISRSSSFVFKGKAANIPEVAGRLGVQYVVEGSIRKIGGRIRVTAQLIDGRRNDHVWAERYDRELKDIFDLQDELVRTIAATIAGRLGHATYQRTKRQSVSDLRAYELYLRGLEHFFAWTPRDNEKAKDLFGAAIAIEPDYAAAHAALSEGTCRSWLNGWTEEAHCDFEGFLELAEKAVQLDNEDSRTHVALGLAYMYHGRHDLARMYLEKAIQLNPSDVHAFAYLSRLELFAGSPQLAIERIQEASRLNPFGKYGWYLGQAYYVAHRYDEAVAAFNSLSNPTAMVLAWLAASHAMTGASEKARSCSEAFKGAAKSDATLRAISGSQEWRAFFSCRWPFQKEDDLDHLIAGLHKAGLPE